MDKTENVEATEEVTPSVAEEGSSDDKNGEVSTCKDETKKPAWKSAGREYKDITNEFFVACSELELGELVHHPVFGLVDAMSAIEIMDPKMDVGMGFTKNEPAPHTFQTAVQAGILKLNDLEYSELIGILDALFAGLVSWLEGHSFDQILYTCLYLHSPNSIEDKSLKAFCWAIHKLCGTIRDIIGMARAFQEEDCQWFGCVGIMLTADFPKMNVIQMLKDAETDLFQKSKNETKTEEIMAVRARLRFLRFLLQSIDALWSDRQGPPSAPNINEIKIQHDLNAALELVPSIRKTIDKGTQPDPNSEALNPMGFSPRVNQRHLPPTFPRSGKIRDRPSSLAFLEELIQRLKLACKVIYQKDYHTTLNFFIDFSKKAGQCLLSRSVLQTLFFGKDYCWSGPTDQLRLNGNDCFEEFLLESIKVFIAPPVLMPKNPLYNNFQAKRAVDIFMMYCYTLNTFVHFLQICGYNRARQRDKLGKLIEEHFAYLQNEAGRVDSCIYLLSSETEANGQHITYFGTWTLYNCLKAMSLYLLLGFELELYSYHEYLYIFWYLYEFLFGFIISALSRAESLLIEHESSITANTTTKQRKNKSKKKKQFKPYRTEIILNHAMQSMCGGYYKAVAGFTLDKRISQPNSKFDNENIRFNHRFAPFANLTSPPQIPYSKFKKMRTHLLRLPSSELYLASAKHFHQARTTLESIQNPDQEMQQMIQIAKINFVVTNLLANGHKKDSTLPPDFDFSQHRYFPIIKLN